MTPSREPERLVFLSNEQYRERFGRDPEPVETSTEPWLDPGDWPGWHQPWPPPTVVVVMGEHGGTGLWNRSPESEVQVGIGALDPTVLRLSGRLLARLTAWNDRFGAHGTSATWADEGRTLAQDVQRELDARGVVVEVRYYEAPAPDLGAR